VGEGKGGVSGLDRRTEDDETGAMSSAGLDELWRVVDEGGEARLVCWVRCKAAL